MSQPPRTKSWGTSAPPRPGQSQSSRSAGIDQAMSALSYMVGGVLVYGGIGWLAAHFLHLDFLIPVGILVGAALSTYLIVQRFGKPGEQAVESWIEQKKAKEADWARRAGRPDRSNRTASTATSGQREDRQT